MRLDPADLHVALEYAFLCFEARENAPARKAEARLIFVRVRDADGADPAVRATAAQAFQNIDAPLEAAIARWKSVLASSIQTFGAHYELAQLAEQRDDLDLAAASYTAAFHLLPERKSVLLELARVEKARGNPEGAMAALLAASRGGEARAAELAREQLPDRYPYVYEFREALELDRVLPLLDQHEFSFLIEDPATVWNLGPQCYPEIAKRYQPLTTHAERLAIDINIVDRYQDVYPTKQQTGTELFELMHLASAAFTRVALYFENSILKSDLGLLAASSAVVTKYTKDQWHTTIESPADLELKWDMAGATVDGKPCPVRSATAIRLPAGEHSIERGARRDGITLIDLNGKLRAASADAGKRMTFEILQ